MIIKSGDYQLSNQPAKVCLMHDMQGRPWPVVIRDEKGRC